MAGVAGALINGARYSYVYDYAAAKYRSIACEVQGSNVVAYDYDNAVHISGGLPSSIYHYGDAGFLEIKSNGEKFDGYDYHTATFFEGTVRGADVELYDYGTAKFYSYQLS